MRCFLLSPASASGERARILLREEASFPLALRLRRRGGAPVGEVMSFLSGLYFRGKLAYARAFAAEAWVITSNHGLMALEAPVTRRQMVAFAGVDISGRDPRYRRPLLRDARALAARFPGEVVLLGSIASGKYVDVLGEVFGPRLVFPAAFVGRGDMSRGGLMLRAADDRQELAYVPVLGAVRHGTRPARLVPRRP